MASRSSPLEEGEILPSPLPGPPPSPPPGPPPSSASRGPKRHPMARPGIGFTGRKIRILTNHFSVRFDGTDDVIFYQYSVVITSGDGDQKKPVEGKGTGRKVMDRLYETYRAELEGKQFAYDGERALFTVGPLPSNVMEFTVILEDTNARPTHDMSPEAMGGDRKRTRSVYRASTFNVVISYSTTIPIRAIAQALRGVDNFAGVQDALRVLDIILRQKQSRRGCLLIRQSFFNDNDRSLVDLTGGVAGCRGFHSSFRTTQGGLSLNMDMSTTMVLQPGPVINFLKQNLNTPDPRRIDWSKAKRLLKNMKVKTKHHKMEYKIIGISEYPCNQQMFMMKNRDGDGRDVEMTVYDYFVNVKKIRLENWSGDAPCLDVGRPKRPNYMPVELCDLLSLQRYTKTLSPPQRVALVNNSRQRPQERMRTITDALRTNRYVDEPLLTSCGISIKKQLTEITGRVLDAPTLKLGGSEDLLPRNGRWNMNNKMFWSSVHIKTWAIVDFSNFRNLDNLARDLINSARRKGMRIDPPTAIIDEEQRYSKADPTSRVNRMFQILVPRFKSPPQFILCLLPDRKHCELYGPWKRKNLINEGVVTQCIVPRNKINDQYLTNVLLKINAKLGGTNSILAVERTLSIPLINKIPTLIVGMDVSHGSPGRSSTPSTAAVVGSRGWPRITHYKASVRSQPPRVEMIESLYKPMPPDKDGHVRDAGIMSEILISFFQSSGKRKPEQIIIFRDGVSESQFSQVLNVELDQIIKAIEHLGVDRLPKFTVIIAQKKHHTKFFLADGPENVPAGTVVDTGVVHPRNYDFYMCAHAGIIGTSRPTHYHILLDEIGFSADDLQRIIHSLSYVYQRSTTAISIVAPIAYAHLAAQQMNHFAKVEDVSETASSLSTDFSEVLPKLNDSVADTMFFC